MIFLGLAKKTKRVYLHQLLFYRECPSYQRDPEEKQKKKRKVKPDTKSEENGNAIQHILIKRKFL